MSAKQGVRFFLACALLAGSVCAAPKLRLSRTTIGPVSAAIGSAAPAQVVDAFNAGDGELVLDVRTSAPWIQVSLTEPLACSLAGGQCFPIRIVATTAGLERGRHTGVVTVIAPGAVDAPQTITVTLDAGGSVPEKIELAVRPEGTDATVVRAGSPISATASTEGGGNWLSIPTQASGSFRFLTSHTIEAKHLAGMGSGEYKGNVVISGSQIADENRSIAVTLKVTEGPIAVAAVSRLDLRLAEGSAVYGQGIGVTNRGAGQLTLEAPAGSQPWLSGEALEGGIGVLLKVDPAGLAPGFYRGELEIRSNAANSPQRMVVALEIMPPAEPWIRPGSLSDRVTTGMLDAIAPGMLLALKGEQLTMRGQSQASQTPWPQELGGARLLVNGVPAAIEVVSPLELQFQVPTEVDGEEALLEIEREGTRGNAIQIPLRPAVPRIVQATFGDGGAISTERPIRAGDQLLIQATGLGKSDPPVAAGAGAAEEARTIETVTVFFSASPFAPRVSAEATASPSPDRPGRYLIRLTVPEGVPAGDFVETRVTAGGSTSNPIAIAVR